MVALAFNVAQLLKEPTGSIRIHHLDDDVSSLVRDAKIVSPLNGDLVFTRTGEGVLVTGRLTTSGRAVCRRCAGDFVANIELDLEETFMMTHDVSTGARLEIKADSVNEENLIDEWHMLDLSEIMRQNLVLAMPPFPVCRQECKGLCPHCGHDLNEGPCDCADEEINPQWSALARLLSGEDSQPN